MEAKREERKTGDLAEQGRSELSEASFALADHTMRRLRRWSVGLDLQNLPENWAKRFCNLPVMVEDMINEPDPEKRADAAKKVISQFEGSNDYVLHGDNYEPGLLLKLVAQGILSMEDAEAIAEDWAASGLTKPDRN